MIKNYFSALVALFCFLASFSTEAQVTATSDYAEIPFELNTVMAIPNVLANDLSHGQAANLGNVTLTMLSNNTPYISIEADGSVWFTPTALASAQVYVVYYRITERADPINSDIGSVTINVGGCLAPELLAGSTITPSCGVSGSVTLNNLPNGNWTLLQWRNGILQPQINGSGATYTVTNSLSGINHFSVVASNSCQSLPIRVNLFSNCYVRIDDTGQYVDLNGDHAVSAGDVVNYQFSITNNREEAIYGIYFTSYSPALIINGEPPVTLATGATDHTSLTGVRVITQSDINAGYVSDRVDLDATIGTVLPMPLITSAYATTYLNVSDGIRLNAFADLNANGTQDAGEINFTKGSFHYEINHDGTMHHVNTNGVLFVYEDNPANSYDFGFDFDEPSPYYALPANAFDNITIAEGSGIVNYNFPIAVVPHYDFSVTIAPQAFVPRPGSVYSNRITYRNNGTSTQSGSVTFAHGSAVSIASISEPAAVPSASGFTFSFNNLQPNEARNIYVSLAVPAIPSVALGDLISNTATVSLAPDDVDPSNNSSSLTQEITGSYDPNDKTEAHGGKIGFAEFTSEDFLTYTIRFENTGNANAINVKIEDVLDEKLDANSVRMVQASHNYKLDRIDNHLSWRFDGVQLPPSVAGTEIGHGFVTFQVKPKSGYAVGDIIPNQAAIYFDLNPAIVTETCRTEFTAPLGVARFDADALSVYPNPAQAVFNISLTNAIIENVTVSDIHGRTILTKVGGAPDMKVDLSEAGRGIYFITVRSAGKQQTIKVLRS